MHRIQSYAQDRLVVASPSFDRWETFSIAQDDKLLPSTIVMHVFAAKLSSATQNAQQSNNVNDKHDAHRYAETST